MTVLLLQCSANSLAMKLLYNNVLQNNTYSPEAIEAAALVISTFFKGFNSVLFYWVHDVFPPNMQIPNMVNGITVTFSVKQQQFYTKFTLI